MDCLKAYVSGFCEGVLAVGKVAHVVAGVMLAGKKLAKA